MKTLASGRRFGCFCPIVVIQLGDHIAKERPFSGLNFSTTLAQLRWEYVGFAHTPDFRIGCEADILTLTC